MKYDAFISYRSGDVQTVRNIVEPMMASALNVWFAEYEIVIDNYDDFQKHINQGIKESSCLICFLGKGYFSSSHCIGELQCFMARDQGRVLCIDLDQREREESLKRPGMAEAPRHQFDGDYSALVYHPAITLALIIFLTASRTDIHLLFIIVMVAVLLLSLRKLVQTIREIGDVVGQKVNR